MYEYTDKLTDEEADYLFNTEYEEWSEQLDKKYADAAELCSAEDCWE